MVFAKAEESSFRFFMRAVMGVVVGIPELTSASSAVGKVGFVDQDGGSPSALCLGGESIEVGSDPRAGGRDGGGL